MNQDVSGGNTTVEQPKNDFVSLTDEQVKASAVEVEPTKADQEPETEAKVDSEKDTDGTEAKKPRQGGFQKKIARLEAELAAVRAQQNPAKADEVKAPAQGSRPSIEDFDKQGKTWAEYNEALVDWKLEQRKIAEKQETQQAEFQKQYQTKAQRFEMQKEEMRQKYPDFDEKLADYDGPTSQIMDMAIVDSEISGEILNYLGNHYEDAEKLAGLGLIEAHKFIAKIETKIDLEKSKEKPAVSATKAPPPVKPVGSGKGSAVPNPETMNGDDFLVYERNRLRNKNR